jgi:hypothetical protein
VAGFASFLGGKGAGERIIAVEAESMALHYCPDPAAVSLNLHGKKGWMAQGLHGPGKDLFFEAFYIDFP